MGHVRRLLMLLLLAAATCVFAAEVRPGDRVRLIEREQHIPAHPTPGDTRVYLRLVSASEAMVLRVDTNQYRLGRGARLWLTRCAGAPLILHPVRRALRVGFS